jgi:ABC-2 type transport system ATP-binding protein
VRTLRDRGTTIVLTTHYLEEAEELADRIGVIDRGRLLVVEEKEALLRRHGAKLLRLVLSAPVETVPVELARLGGRLEEGGGAIAVEATAGTSFGAVLAAAAAAGLAPKDVETRRTTLEDVFVRLLADQRASDAAGAEPSGRSAAAPSGRERGT